MNKNIIIGIVVVVLVAGGVFWFVQSQNNAINNPSPAPVVTQTPVATSSPLPSPAPTPTPETTTPPAPTPAPKPVTHSVTIQGFAFNQASITIKKGDVVIWTNKDSAGHTVTGNNGGPSSPTIGINGTYSYTFTNAGTFAYHCAIHPSMTGTVVVQ